MHLGEKRNSSRTVVEQRFERTHLPAQRRKNEPRAARAAALVESPTPGKQPPVKRKAGAEAEDGDAPRAKKKRATCRVDEDAEDEGEDEVGGKKVHMRRQGPTELTRAAVEAVHAFRAAAWAERATRRLAGGVTYAWDEQPPKEVRPPSHPPRRVSPAVSQEDIVRRPDGSVARYIKPPKPDGRWICSALRAQVCLARSPARHACSQRSAPPA